jgi:DinB superfamily
MTHDEIIDTLQHTASRIEEIAQNLSEGELQQRGADGHWSIKELVGHLRDAAEMYGERIRRVASEDNPFLPSYDQDVLMADGHYETREIGPVIGELDSLNKQTAALLSSLRDHDWQRRGQHEERGRMTIEDLAQVHANHLREHLAEIDQRAQEVSGGESELKSPSQPATWSHLC